MYLPKHYEETRVEVMQDLIDAKSLATWVQVQDGALLANHIPFLLDRSQGELGTLYGHVARNNAAWKHADGSAQSLLVFQGEAAYISPNWYATKVQTGKAVPTWAYATVHVSGAARAIDDKTWLRALLERLSTKHEASQPKPWRVDEAPEDYIEALLGMIVGIEIPIAKLQGKWKINQHTSAADKAGVHAGLAASGAAGDRDMAALMQSRMQPGT